MLNYHRTCAQMSVFIVNTIGMFIKFTDIMYIVGRDFLNIIWSLGLLSSYAYNQKLFMFGFAYGYILKKILEFYVHWALHGIAYIIAYYCCLRLTKLYQVHLLGDFDPIETGSQDEIVRITRALTYLGFIHEEIPQRLEFYEEWGNFVKRVEEYDPFENDTESDAADDEESDADNEESADDEESDGEEESGEEEESETGEELVECDECGVKDIDPDDLDHNEKNLGDIGGGYAHEHCMSEEKLKEYEAALCGDENEEMDEELNVVNKDDENEEIDEEEPIKRGWFNWEKGEQSRKTV